MTTENIYPLDPRCPMCGSDTTTELVTIAVQLDGGTLRGLSDDLFRHIAEKFESYHYAREDDETADKFDSALYFEGARRGWWSADEVTTEPLEIKGLESAEQLRKFLNLSFPGKGLPDGISRAVISGHPERTGCVVIESDLEDGDIIHTVRSALDVAQLVGTELVILEIYAKLRAHSRQLADAASRSNADGQEAEG